MALTEQARLKTRFYHIKWACHYRAAHSSKTKVIVRIFNSVRRENAHTHQLQNVSMTFLEENQSRKFQSWYPTSSWVIFKNWLEKQVEGLSDNQVEKLGVNEGLREFLRHHVLLYLYKQKYWDYILKFWWTGKSKFTSVKICSPWP